VDDDIEQLLDLGLEFEGLGSGFSGHRGCYLNRMGKKSRVATEEVNLSVRLRSAEGLEKGFGDSGWIFFAKFKIIQF
jgi:hypothetical protein